MGTASNRNCGVALGRTLEERRGGRGLPSQRQSKCAGVAIRCKDWRRFVTRPLGNNRLKTSQDLCLITGATGLVGRNVLASLHASKTDRSFAALTRNIDGIRAEQGTIMPVEGDLRLPNLGIDGDQLPELVRRITEVIHCAADIRFDRPLEAAREINVAGTRRVLDLARRCPRLKRFAHISTTYVSGRSTKPLPESRFENTHGFFSSYQESKYEAEHLAIEAFNDLPVAIYRLSTVIGDSRTGKVEQYNHFHQLLRLVRHNLLPILPGCPAARADFVATDWAAAAIAWLFEHRFEPGSIRNISAGPGDTLRMSDLLRMAFDSLGEGGRPPELVSAEEFNRYARIRMDRGDARFSQLMHALRFFLPYFSSCQRFENTATLDHLQSSGIVRVGTTMLFSRVLDYMKNQNQCEEITESGDTSSRASREKRPPNTEAEGQST